MLINQNNYEKVGVGVTVLLTWNDHILLAKRQGSHGAGDWDTPGGHLEPGETVRECAVRETAEETGITLLIDEIHEIGFTEDFFEPESKHYLSCVVHCEIDGATAIPVVLEPHKFSTPWEWYPLKQMPSPLFLPIINAFKKYDVASMLSLRAPRSLRGLIF